MAAEQTLEARVLVADDEPSMGRGIRRVLESCGATVALAETGPQAAQMLAEQDYDVAFLDLIMPSFGGMELLERISAAGLPVVPVVITAHAGIDTAVEAVRKGAFDYLPKPFVPQELILRAERALAWRRLREEAQRRLLELDSDKTQLHTIVNTLVDGVLVVNAEGQVVLSNPAARAALDFAHHPGETPLVEEVLTEPRLLGLLAQVVAEQAQRRVAHSTHFERADRVYMARVVPLHTGGGEFLGTATVVREVTELMSLERAKSRFMAMVAHELKSPLAAVQGFLNVLLFDDTMDHEKARALVERAARRTEGMAQLVRDLLELSQSEAAPLRRLEPLALPELVQEALDQHRELAERQQVQMTAESDPACPLIHADRSDLSRLIGNLVSNAVKYNRPGGRVTVRLRPQAEGALLEVQDTGLGMPIEALDRLGEEFFRINLPDRRGIVGTGLGLSLVKRAVDNYHGRLEVESVLGEGSTFGVWLPCGGPDGVCLRPAHSSE